jgi:hypothetical protein
MEQIENTQEKVVTTSDASEFVGPGMDQSDVAILPRNMNPLVEPDVFDWTKRLFSFEFLDAFPQGIPFGPTTNTHKIWSINRIFDEHDILEDLLQKFYGVSWTSIKVRFSVSDPKNLVGGYAAGWWPYQDWYDKNSEETFDVVYDETELLWPGWLQSPYAYIQLFGMSKDLTFTIPWTYKEPLVPCQMLRYCDETSPGKRLTYGSPCIWYGLMPSSYVTSVMNPAKLRCMIEIEGLKWYGPQAAANPDSLALDNHSGAEVVAAAQMAATVGTAIGAEALSAKIGNFFAGEEIEEIGQPNTYDQPQAVQMAFAGDTTSVDYSVTTPIFAPRLSYDSVSIPSILELLKRPQYIGDCESLNGGVVATATNNPMSFGQSETQCLATWFRYIGMLNRYWRGTINLHCIVAGHPLIQVQFRAQVMYQGAKPYNNNEQTFVDYVQHVSTFPGSKHIVIPMPYLTDADYMPVQDAYPSNTEPADGYTTKVFLFLEVVSTMMDSIPVVPMYLFVSAGDDFAYYQPRPPGLYDASELEPETVALEEVLDNQCHLPLEEEKEVANTRYMLTKDPGTLVTLPTIYDYCKLWCRAMPFLDYDNDDDEEPTLDATVGFANAGWYPPIDRTADTDANNSWYFTLDYIAYFASMFMYWKGDMSFKLVLAKREDDDPGAYAYVALGDIRGVARQKTHCPYSYIPNQIPPDANLGTGTVVTPFRQQPVLELTLPYRGSNVWSYSLYNGYFRAWTLEHGPKPNCDVKHNISLITDEDELRDAMFRKIGPNFSFAVETGLPPATMWAARGFDWSS